MSLSKQQLKQMQTLAQRLKPVVMIGNRGLTEAVLEESDRALTSHELIKIKMAGIARDDRKPVAHTICERLSANLVQQIGQVIVIYRENPELHSK